MKSNKMFDCLLGGALGDAIGLPAEGINARRIARLWPGPLRHRLVFGNGMVSDDTEHAVMTLLSLMESEQDPARFARRLAGRLRWWLAMIPAGIGLATARSILKLWIGVNPARSGVWSAGNGPLMRAPVIGVHFADDPDARQRHVEASTIITHSDPRALESAQIVARASALAVSHVTDESEILDQLAPLVESEEMKTRFPILREMLANRESVSAFADRICRKPGFVTGFAPDSASVALFSWLRHRGDYQATIEAVVRAGGDTDTIAFIAGSIAGIDCGSENFPSDWSEQLLDWPINRKFLEAISNGEKATYPLVPISLLRNAVFLLIVLTHGFRRLLPPY